ncbi:CBS domain-containing protein [Planosporangium sp. 12N6]|uniref:CBS domain-containing protein n=1 Tax=Planosporangium spinosum TaxID=3402278 RepID=UPI003CF606DF
MTRWTVGDVMTTPVVAVREEAPFREIVDLLETYKVSGVPVVDRGNLVVGVVSERDLLARMEFADGAERPRRFERRRARLAREKAGAETARDLMTSPPVTVLTGTPVTAAAKLMTSTGVKRLPVVNLAGLLVGIVTRSDLLKVFLRPDAEIRADVWQTLRQLPVAAMGQVDVLVSHGVVTLAGEVEHRRTAEAVVRLAQRVDGVVDVVDRVTYWHDDLAETMAALP